MSNDPDLAAILGATLGWLQRRVQNFLRPSNNKLQSASLDGAAGDDGPKTPVQVFFKKVYGWPPAKLDPKRETAWLDGLRGVAATFVMTYHYHLEWWTFQLEAPYGAKPEQWTEFWRLPFLRIPMAAGHAQVSVFFVLSGFVLSWSPLGNIAAGRLDRAFGTLSSATFRRWMRLYIPCWIVGLYSLFEHKVGIINLPSPPDNQSFFPFLWHWLKSNESWANPLWIDRGEREYLYNYSWTMWTIPHEFAGSLLVFVIVLAVARIQDYRRRTLVTGSIAVYALLRVNWTYWLFASGVVLADYIKHNGGFRELSRTTGPTFRAWMVGMLVVALFLAGVPEHAGRFDDIPAYPQTAMYEWLDALTPAGWVPVEGGGRFWWNWAGLLFIFSASHLTTARAVFELPLCRYLGRISFMMYVTHRLVYNALRGVREHASWLAMSKVRDEATGWDLWQGNALQCTLRDVLCWVVLFPVAILVAHWAEVLIDAPAVRFAKWVDDKFVNGMSSEGNKAGARTEEMVGLMPLQNGAPEHRPERLA